MNGFIKAFTTNCIGATINAPGTINALVFDWLFLFQWVMSQPSKRIYSRSQNAITRRKALRQQKRKLQVQSNMLALSELRKDLNNAHCEVSALKEKLNETERHIHPIIFPSNPWNSWISVTCVEVEKRLFINSFVSCKATNSNRKVQQFLLTKSLKSSLGLVNLSINNFSVEKTPIATGVFGKVFKGRFSDVLIAVKKCGLSLVELEFLLLSVLWKPPFSNVQLSFPAPYGISNKSLVMGFARGSTLRRTLRDKVIVDWKKFIASLLAAVKFMHDRKVVHLDLHDENVLVYRDSCTIIDFGKATTSEFPIHYHLTIRERHKYRKFYSHICSDFVNGVCRSSPASDVFAIGFICRIITHSTSCLLEERKWLLDLSQYCSQPASRRPRVEDLIAFLGKV